MSILLFFNPSDPITGNAEVTQPLQTVDASGTVDTGILQTIIYAYPYMQYADDPNIVAFFTAYNILAQTYLNWFNQTGLALYTNPVINGPLLDWIGQGIYGIARPVFATLVTHYSPAALNAFPRNTMAVNGSRYSQSGTSVVANDDYYKRVLTWATYIGNGRYFSIPNLRLRIARFLYGVNGTDVSLELAQNVQIEPVEGEPTLLSISLPTSLSVQAQLFEQALAEGILAFPFQLRAIIEAPSMTAGLSAFVAGPITARMTAGLSAVVQTEDAGSLSTSLSAIVQARSTVTAGLSAFVSGAPTVVKITGGSTFTIPSDFNPAKSYAIECIGGGQSGEAVAGPSAGGIGGGYAKITTLAGIAPGNVYTVSVGVAGANTWFKSTATVLAAGGGSGTPQVGSVTRAGGAGGSGNVQAGGGGGGAAGPNGNGVPGVNAPSSTVPGAGGAGDNGFGGAGGLAPGGSGQPGSEWHVTGDGDVGSGGGGAGGYFPIAGGDGGDYGGGGGGAGSRGGVPGAFGDGVPGLIVFTYEV